MLKISVLLIFALSVFPILSGADAMPAACNGLKLPSPVRVILPAQPGNSSDVAARKVTASATKKYGISFVIENRPGASGNLGTGAAKTAMTKDKDGVLLFSQAPEMVLNPDLKEPLPTHTLKDFRPVTYVAAVSYVFLCHPSAKLPAAALANIDSLIEHVKKNNLSLNIADGGISNTTGIALTKLGQATKLKVGNYSEAPLYRISFKATSDAMNALMGNHVDCMFQSTTGADIILKDPKSKVKAIAITSVEDSKIYKLPAVKNSLQAAQFGDLKNWMGFFAKSDMDPKLVSCYSQIFQNSLADESVKASFSTQGLMNDKNDPKNPEAFAAFVQSEAARMKPMSVMINETIGAASDVAPPAKAAAVPEVRK